MYTERGRQWREVEQLTEENQEILQEGCKACVTHLTRVTNVMWTHQEHRRVCLLRTNTLVVVQMWHARSAFEAMYYFHVTTLFLKCTPYLQDIRLVSADGKFWFWGKVLQVSDDVNIEIRRENSATLGWWASIKGRSLSRRLRYILVWLRLYE